MKNISKDSKIPAKCFFKNFSIFSSILRNLFFFRRNFNFLFFPTKFKNYQQTSKRICNKMKRFSFSGNFRFFAMEFWKVNCLKKIVTLKMSGNRFKRRKLSLRSTDGAVADLARALRIRRSSRDRRQVAVFIRKIANKLSN